MSDHDGIVFHAGGHRVGLGVPYMLGRAVGRRWHARRDGSPQPAAALAPIERRDRG